MKTKNHEKLIAVIGATGQQGGGVVRALQASSQFKVRALSRNPGKHRELADEVVEADLNRPETLKAAFEAAHGVFLVTNFREKGADELKQATAAVRAAKDFSYWEAHTYLGSDSSDRIALANKIAGRQPTKFSTWARVNVPIKEAA
jgi:hypothetical protein